LRDEEQRREWARQRVSVRIQLKAALWKGGIAEGPEKKAKRKGITLSPFCLVCVVIVEK